MRTIRIPDDLWDALRAAAAKNDETASDALRRAAETYVRKNRAGNHREGMDSMTEASLVETLRIALREASPAPWGWALVRNDETDPWKTRLEVCVGDYQDRDVVASEVVGMSREDGALIMLLRNNADALVRALAEQPPDAAE